MTTIRKAALALLMSAGVVSGVFAQSGNDSLGKMATGRVVNIDVTAGTVTLENGMVYAMPSVDYLKQVKLGDTVTIEYTSDTQGLLVATSVKIAA